MVKIRKKVRKNKRIRILFLVQQRCKWQYEYVFRRFREIPGVEVIFGIFPVYDERHLPMDALEQYLRQKGCCVVNLFENGNPDIEKFNPDIVFYQQQWSLKDNMMPYHVSKFALTFYCSYSFGLLQENGDYTDSFHCFLYKYFVGSELTINRYKLLKWFSNNCELAGFPKLDAYCDKLPVEVEKCWKEPEKIRIIYAPHHSLDFGVSLKLATFAQNGRFILDYAKHHPETTWIFKPHPRFRIAVIEAGIMSESELDSYFACWAAIGKVYLDDDYIKLFRTCDFMITDCCSFLGEFFPSGKTLIRMVSKNGVPLNALGEKVCSHYISVHDNLELKTAIDNCVFEKNKVSAPKVNVLNTSDILYGKTGSVGRCIADCVLRILKNE